MPENIVADAHFGIPSSLFRVISRLPEDNPEFKELQLAVSELDPEVFFSALCITKREVSQYETQLKKQMIRWGQLGLHQEVFNLCSVSVCLCILNNLQGGHSSGTFFQPCVF